MAVVKQEKYLFQMIHRDKFGDEAWLDVVGDDTREFSHDKGAVSGLFCAVLAHTEVMLCAFPWIGASSPVAQDRKKSML